MSVKITIYGVKYYIQTKNSPHMGLVELAQLVEAEKLLRIFPRPVFDPPTHAYQQYNVQPGSFVLTLDILLREDPQQLTNQDKVEFYGHLSGDTCSERMLKLYAHLPDFVRKNSVFFSEYISGKSLNKFVPVPAKQVPSSPLLPFAMPEFATDVYQRLKAWLDTVKDFTAVLRQIIPDRIAPVIAERLSVDLLKLSYSGTGYWLKLAQGDPGEIYFQGNDSQLVFGESGFNLYIFTGQLRAEIDGLMWYDTHPIVVETKYGSAGNQDQRRNQVRCITSVFGEVPLYLKVAHTVRQNITLDREEILVELPTRFLIDDYVKEFDFKKRHRETPAQRTAMLLYPL